MPHPATTAETHPLKPAIVMGLTGEVVSYQELDERSNQGAQLFRSLGLQAGDHIAIMMSNNARYLEIVWAAQRAGLIFTPINAHWSPEETLYVLENCKARLFIGSVGVAHVAEQVLCAPGHVDHFYMVGGTRPGFQSWEAAIEEQTTTPIADESNGVPLLYSSGTTGRPKGVFVPPVEEDVNTPPAVVPYLAEPLGFNETTVYLSPAPLYHAGPMHYSMMATWQGGTVIIMEEFDAERALKLIERYRVTHSQWVPIMFVRMLKLPRALRESYDLHSMEVSVHASASCPVKVKEQILDWWGDNLVEYYCSSEGAGMTTIGAEEWREHPGSVGRPLVGEVHVLDEYGCELAAGEIGTIYFKGDHVRFDYYGEPELTKSAYHSDCFATAGDLGYVDEEGYLFLTGRQNFTIVANGVDIYPQEVENTLIDHHKIADVAVVGLPHAEAGEEVKAIVQPTQWHYANDDTAAEIIAWLGERLEPAKIPHYVEFHPKLPRLDNGKLYKQQLLDDYDMPATNDSPERQLRRSSM